MPAPLFVPHSVSSEKFLSENSNHPSISNTGSLLFLLYVIQYPMREIIRSMHQQHVAGEHGSKESVPTGKFHTIKNRKREGYNPAYIAARECSREKLQHYHVALMMNGHKTQNIHDHIQTAERLWEKTLRLPPKYNDERQATSYGLIDDCMRNRQGQPQENGVMFRKDRI